MNTTREQPFSSEQIAEYQALASRIVAAPQLSSSPKLQELFLYLFDCALKNANSAATEQQIGIHIFHRQPGYNSSDDSIVRSQMRLLRIKLCNYFENQGQHEKVTIVIPKGHYFPTFVSAGDGAVCTAAADSASQQAEFDEVGHEGAGPSEIISKRRFPLRGVLFVVALVLAMAAGYAIRLEMNHQQQVASDPFWAPFMRSDDSIVIYSNPIFSGSLVEGFHLQTNRTSPGFASPEDDTYTGVGEVAAVMTITRLFDAHNVRFTLKRSQLVTWDEARMHNLIFVGAPSQNGALRDLKMFSQFQIALDANNHGYIHNLHPSPGEPVDFPVMNAENETAIIALMPGLSQNTSIAVFCGLSTLGTEAAVEYMSHRENIDAIASKLGATHGKIPPFEAVLNVTVRGEVPISVNLVTVHRHAAA